MVKLFPHTTAPSNVANQLRTLVVQWVREQVLRCEPEPTSLYGKLLRIVEPALLSEVLRQLDGRCLPASRWLGLSRVTVRKMTHARLNSSDAGDE
jgi:DNA-binding protein Fis